MRSYKFRQKIAFSLAEILITLAVIGIVATLSIPSLLNNINNAEYKTAYKKAFGDLNSALERGKLENEFIANSNNLNNVNYNIGIFKKYFNVSKSCINSVDEGCWVDSCMSNNDCWATIPSLNIQGKGAGFVDSSGRQWIHYKAGVGFLYIMTDTNGDKGPNRMGRDRFAFYVLDINNNPNLLEPYKIVPQSDCISPVPSACSLGNCYYTSWLTGEK